jgi:hypothetical protein
MKTLLVTALLASSIAAPCFAYDGKFTPQQIAALPQDKVQVIKQACERQWHDDFEMRLFCEDKQYSALQAIIARNADAPK